MVFGTGIACLGFINSLGMLYGLSCVSGVGLGIIYPGATMTNLIRYFPDKRGLASGLLAAGYGLGPVVWAPITVGLIGQVGLMWALRIMGGLFFVLVALCSRLVSTAPSGYAPAGWTSDGGERIASRRWPKTRTGSRCSRPRSSGCSPSSSRSAPPRASWSSGTPRPIAQDVLGMTPAAAGRVVSFLAIGMVLGKIGWGALSDRIGRFPVFVMMLIVAAAALLVLWHGDHLRRASCSASARSVSATAGSSL